MENETGRATCEANTATKRNPYSAFATPVLAAGVTVAIAMGAIYAGHTRGSLSERLEQDHRLNEFGQVINQSSLTESLGAADWEYTVVAPTDQAFDKAQWRANVTTQGVAPASSITPAYADMQAYDYVAPVKVAPQDVKFGEHVRVPSISGQDLVFSRIGENPEDLRVNGMPVNTVEAANNGVIYLIDEIIPFPQTQTAAE